MAEELKEKSIQNGNPYNLVDNENQNNQGTSSEKKEPGQFLKKIIKSFAKMAGLPDPETGAPAKNTAQSTGNDIQDKNTTVEAVNTGATPTTLEQDVVAQEEQKKQEEKKTFSFDSIMSGVTGVLDKIEKKVEEKTGLDLDAPLKKREERLNNQEGQTEPEIEVDKNNEDYLSENH